MTMTADAAQRAARLLLDTWTAGGRIAALPEDCRPRDDAAGFAIQQSILALAGDRRAGWKIAATSKAGQAHIGVDGPLPGTLLQSRFRDAPATISLKHNQMLVAEAEFAFRMARTLSPRAEPYGVAEVLDAVATLHPAIEVPDSRYDDFAKVGGPQLLADNACACWFALGAATTADWRGIDLSKHGVTASIDGRAVAQGSGANVLGDPREALAWLANKLSSLGTPLSAGQVVTTGTCVVPVAVAPGETVSADFGVLGRIEVRFDT